MKKLIVAGSVFGAAFLLAGFAESGAWMPALGCIGWMLFVLYANTRKKPDAATPGKNESAKILYLYSITDPARAQGGK